MKWIAIAWLLLALTACTDNSSPPPPERLLLSAGELGVFDPSLAAVADSERVWMSYSSVDSSRWYDPELYWSVSIRLAFSDDDGLNWQDAGVELAAFSEPVLGDMPVTSPEPAIETPSAGIWQSETSSLVYDPGALPGEEWKLIWFQYLNANLTSYFLDYSWISLKTAATPEELASATPIKLFGGYGLQDDSQITSAPVFSPIAGLPAVQLNTALTRAAPGADLADLQHCVFAEPGMHAGSDALYLAMFCSDVISAEESIMLFRCDNPCSMTDAVAWEYLGKLLTPDDADVNTRHDHYQAPDIFEHNGRIYLLVTPVQEETTEIETETGPATETISYYDGCRLYQFADIDTGALLREDSGVLLEAQRVRGEPQTHHGACSAIDGLLGGIIFSQFEVDNPPDKFRLYKSNLHAP